MKHPVRDRINPSFVIVDIDSRVTLTLSALSIKLPVCKKIQMTA